MKAQSIVELYDFLNFTNNILSVFLQNFLEQEDYAM